MKIFLSSETSFLTIRSETLNIFLTQDRTPKDLMDIKNTLETCNEQYLTINFGDSVAIVISRANIKNVIPECSVD